MGTRNVYSVFHTQMAQILLFMSFLELKRISANDLSGEKYSKFCIRMEHSVPHQNLISIDMPFW